MSHGEFAGRRAVVTGGASGIGATTGTDLAVDGGMSGLRLRPQPRPQPVNEERS